MQTHLTINLHKFDRRTLMSSKYRGKFGCRTYHTSRPKSTCVVPLEGRTTRWQGRVKGYLLFLHIACELRKEPPPLQHAPYSHHVVVPLFAYSETEIESNIDAHLFPQGQVGRM